jgi:hypothetical protein
VVSFLKAPSRKGFSFLPLLLTAFATAQSAPAPTIPQLSPQSAYDQAMHPLEMTRSAIGNWSDSELNALAAAIKQATEACGARTPGQFTGDDLIAYARLCALGQQWPTVFTAATRYITSTDVSKSQLAQAYAYQVGATLHANDPKAILADSLAMLNAVPYNSITDGTLYGALHYLQLAFTPDALTLYAARQPILLAALRNPRPSTSATATETAVPIHTLYADGRSSSFPETPRLPQKPSPNWTPLSLQRSNPTTPSPSAKPAVSTRFSAHPSPRSRLLSPSLRLAKPHASTLTTALPPFSSSSPTGARSAFA